MFPLYRRALATASPPRSSPPQRPRPWLSPPICAVPTRKTRTAVQPGQDLRTPDAQDVAAGRQIVASTPVQVAKATNDGPTASGFDWGDAALGAGGALAIALAGAGGTVALVRRRRVTSTRSAGLVG